jgi:hypothetical protein
MHTDIEKLLVCRKGKDFPKVKVGFVVEMV